MKLVVATTDGDKTIEAESVNEWFAVHGGRDEFDRWTLTHVPTGCLVAEGLRDEATAIRLAHALTASFPTQWAFTDPARAKEIPNLRALVIAEINRQRTQPPLPAEKEPTR